MDQSHPVLEVLRTRALSGSAPGARQDDHRVALVIEGGGMRGVVSAGMTAALERLGLTPCFDLVVGASAGAINGAALLAGVAREGAAMYHGPLASRSFVNPARVLRGRPVIDVGYILRYTSMPAGTSACWPTPPRCIAWP
jgi:predicted patatin/cPLA2 family phospholipase